MVDVRRTETVTNLEWGRRPSSQVDAARYTAVEFADREKAALWPRVWQMACPLAHIPEPGDFVEYEVTDRSYLVLRQEDGTVRAFLNACLHRGAKLKGGCGAVKNITCSIHAWCWNLDGSLHHVV